MQNQEQEENDHSLVQRLRGCKAREEGIEGDVTQPKIGWAPRGRVVGCHTPTHARDADDISGDWLEVEGRGQDGVAACGCCV